LHLEQCCRRREAHGPAFEPGGIRFRLWAPAEQRVGVVLEDGAEIAMTPRSRWRDGRTASSKPSSTALSMARSIGLRCRMECLFPIWRLDSSLWLEPLPFAVLTTP
jgi:hypothetical protein